MAELAFEAYGVPSLGTPNFVRLLLDRYLLRYKSEVGSAYLQRLPELMFPDARTHLLQEQRCIPELRC